MKVHRTEKTQKMTKSDERLLDRGASQLVDDDINFLLMTNYLYALHSMTSFSNAHFAWRSRLVLKTTHDWPKIVAIDRKISHYAFIHAQCTLAHAHIHKYGKKFGHAKRQAKSTVQFIRNYRICVMCKALLVWLLCDVTDAPKTKLKLCEIDRCKKKMMREKWTRRKMRNITAMPKRTKP